MISRNKDHNIKGTQHHHLLPQQIWQQESRDRVKDPDLRAQYERDYWRNESSSTTWTTSQAFLIPNNAQRSISGNGTELVLFSDTLRNKRS